MLNDSTQNGGQSTGKYISDELNDVIWGRNMRCEKEIGNY